MSNFFQRGKLILGGAILGSASCIAYKYATIKMDKRPLSQSIVRFARPTDNLNEVVSMYKNGLKVVPFRIYQANNNSTKTILTLIIELTHLCSLNQ